MKADRQTQQTSGRDYPCRTGPAALSSGWCLPLCLFVRSNSAAEAVAIPDDLRIVLHIEINRMIVFV